MVNLMYYTSYSIYYIVPVTSRNPGGVCMRGMFDERPKIFKDRDVLTSLYVPDVLQDREEETEEISQYLGYVLDGATPPSLLVVGVAGTGKTACVRYILGELRKHVADVVINYTVSDTTAYQVLVTIARSCGCDVPLTGIGFKSVWENFSEFLGNRKAIFVMDELDKMLAKDGTKLLYHLSRRPNTCIIGISNKLTVMEMIDDLRVRSSFRPRKVNFPPYGAYQLREILEHRAELAFHPGVLTDDVIPLCSALAARRNGDARYALDLLMFSGDIAIRRKKEKIEEEDVRLAEKEVEMEFIRRSISQLRENQKILLYSVLTTKEPTPSEIYKRFNKTADKLGYAPLTQRRLSSFLKELEFLGLVEIEKKGRGKRRGVTWIVFPSTTISEDVMLEALKRSI